MALDVRLQLEDGSGVVLLEYTALLLENSSGNILTEDGEGELLLEWSADGRLSSQVADPEGLKLQRVVHFLAATTPGSNTHTNAPSSPHNFSNVIDIPRTGAIAIVGVEIKGTSTGEADISAVTLGGASVTKITGKNLNDGTVGGIWFGYVTGLTTGLKDVSVTFSSSPTHLLTGVVILGGHDPVSPLGTAVTAAGTGAPATPTVDVSDSENGDMVIDLMAIAHGTAMTGNQTERWEDNFFPAHAGQQTAPGGGYSPITMSWTSADGDWWAIAGVTVKANRATDFLETHDGKTLLIEHSILPDGVLLENGTDVLESEELESILLEAEGAILLEDESGFLFAEDTIYSRSDALVVLSTIVPANTDITPPVGSVTISGVAPLNDYGLLLDIGSLSLTGFAPTVQDSGAGGTFITPSTGTLTLTGNQPTQGITITPSEGSLVLTAIAGRNDQTLFPVVSALILSGVPPPNLAFGNPTVAGSLSLTGTSSLLSLTITPSTGALTLTGQPAHASLLRQPTVGSLILTGFAPTVQDSGAVPTVNITPNTGVLRLTRIQSETSITPGTGTLRLDRSLNVRPATGALILTGQNPTLTPAGVENTNIRPNTGTLLLFDLVGVTPSTGVLTLIGFAPRPTLAIVPTTGQLFLGLFVDVRPFTGTLTIQGQTPNVIRPIVPLTGALNLTGQQPTIGTVITAATGSLNVAGVAPSLLSGTVIIPPVGGVAATGVAGFNAQALTTSQGSLSLAGFQPNIQLGTSTNTNMTPNSGVLTLTAFASTTQTTSTNFLRTPNTGALTATGIPPSTYHSTVLVPNTGDLILSANQPVMMAPIRPLTGSLAFDGIDLTVQTDFRLTPQTGSLGVAGVQAQIKIEFFRTPSGTSLVLTGIAGRNDRAIIPTTGSLALNGAPPNVEITSATNTNRTPATATLALSGAAPTLTTTSTNFTVITQTGAIAIEPEGNAPTPVLSELLTPTTGALVLVGLPALDTVPRQVELIDARGSVSELIRERVSLSGLEDGESGVSELTDVKANL